MSAPQTNLRSALDLVLVEIVDYVLSSEIDNELALETARHCLLDTLGCGLEALSYPACTKLLGPLVQGTSFQIDTVKAAFDIGAAIRWLDFNDTWLAAEWGHPSDNLGGILATADWLSRTALAAGKPPLTMHAVLVAMVKAHEIQGCFALENAFNRVGLAHVLLVKVASAAVVEQLFGLTHDDLINALSRAFIDGQALRTYRHAPNTGSRKSWAAADYEDEAAPRPAHRRTAREDRLRRGSVLHAGLSRPGQVRDCQRADGRIQRRHGARRGGGRLPAQASPPSRRRHGGLKSEVQHLPRGIVLR